MFALADANNFYASCETVFRPDLRGKPICVVSNNDGCVIARSADYVELKWVLRFLKTNATFGKITSISSALTTLYTYYVK